MFDPSKLTALSPNRRKVQNFDISYSGKTGRFLVSDAVWGNNELGSNGISISRYAGGKIVLSVQPAADSQLLKGRANSTKKGRSFTCTELVSMLNLSDKNASFSLEVAGEDNGVTYYFVVPFSGAPSEATSVAQAPAPTQTSNDSDESDESDDDFGSDFGDDEEEDVDSFLN